jgi:hypothetical protein
VWFSEKLICLDGFEDCPVCGITEDNGASQAGIGATEQYVLPWVGIQSDNAVHFLLAFAVRNTFVLLIAYLHWPYEVIRNKAEKTNEEDIHADGGFFVSVDDD